MALNLRLALTFARRELRGGFKGFRVFFLCLFMGSAAISGVESLYSALLGGLRDQDQTLLGGDVSGQLTHRSRLRAKIRSAMAAPVPVSRLPVGSSANKIAG